MSKCISKLKCWEFKSLEGKQLLCAKEIKEFRATKDVNSSFLMNEYILDFCTSSFN